jgi:hypothetical protein
VESACVLKCLATDLVVDEMVVEVLIAEEVVVAAVDITEVLHAIMIGIMTGNI